MTVRGRDSRGPEGAAYRVELWEEDEPAIRRYLLGGATEAEARRIEVTALADEGFAEGVDVVEGELIDEYVWGELAGLERLMFVVKYLGSEEGRKRVAFADGLRRYVRSRAGLGTVSRRYVDLLAGARDGGDGQGDGVSGGEALAAGQPGEDG